MADCILVFLPNWVGDVVMATPALRALRAARPDARIVAVGRFASRAVLADTPWIDAFVADTSKQKPKLRNFLRTLRAIRAENPTLAILMPNSTRSGILARFSRAKRRIGYARDGRGGMLTDRLTAPKDAAGKFLPAAMIDYYANLLEPLGLDVADRTMELPLPDGARQQADTILAAAGLNPAQPMGILNPGAAFGTSKLWPAERYAALADRLVTSHGAQIVINAAPNPNERRLANEVAEAMGGQPLLNFAEQDNTLDLLKALCHRAALVVTNDTGARHIAAAMGSAVVTIFGSTDPAWTTLDYSRERIVRANVPCSPCQQKTCPNPPGETYLQCLTHVTIDDVYAASVDLLDAKGGAG